LQTHREGVGIVRQVPINWGDSPVMGSPPPYALNRDLADGLRGARLVLELGLDEDRFATIAEVVDHLAAAGQRPKAIRQSYPALYASYLVFTGVYRYVSGNFWPDVHPGLTGQGYDPGYEFLTAVRSLGLESFDRLVEEEHAQPWVTRILAHGGIPRSCLDPFLDLLSRELARGAVDATELLAHWRVNNARLHGLHQPTRRFLLFGGAPAVDLLDRCIELMRERRRHAIDAAAELGVPRYMAEAIAGLPPVTGSGAGSTHRSLSVPRPFVRLDPYSGLGPVVVLPAVPPGQADGSWRVDAGQQLNRYDASAVTDTPIRLSPASSYAVEFVSASEGERRQFTFEALGRLPALFLDPDTERLLREPSVLAADDVWVLSPPGVQAQTRRHGAGSPVAPRQIQDLPAPAGAWTGWSLEHIDLADAGSVELIRADKVLARIPVTSARERLRLAGEPVAGVTTAQGAPVYATAPVIEIPPIAGLEDGWQIRLTIGDRNHTWAVSGEEARAVPLAPIIGDAVATVTLRVRGPLGFDLREVFAVVDGLQVRRPTNLVRPGTAPATVAVRAAGLMNDAEPGQWSRRELPEPLTSISCSARTEGSPPLTSLPCEPLPPALLQRGRLPVMLPERPMSDLSTDYDQLARSWTHEQLAGYYNEARRRGERLPECDQDHLIDRPVAMLAIAVPACATLSIAIHVLHMLPATIDPGLVDQLLANVQDNGAVVLHRCHRALDLDGRAHDYNADEWRPAVYDIAAPLLQAARMNREPPSLVENAQEAVRWLSRAIVGLDQDSPDAAAAIVDSLARILALDVFAQVACKPSDELSK
jgi:hypothetical protein